MKDKKLLYHLSINGRATDSELAKIVGLSKNSVKYRIQRLKEERIITNFSAVINLGSIKTTTICILIKFNEDIYEKKELIEYFQNHKYADWIISLSGNWDLFVEFVIKDLNHFHELIKEMIKSLNQTIYTYQIFFSSDTLRVEHLIADFYKDLKIMELPIKKRTPKKHDLDKTDRKILNLLTKDSSMSYIEIAKKLGLTMDIVRYRIKNLSNNEIIIKFFPEINLKKLGYTEYLYTIKLKDLSEEKNNKIRNSINQNQNITYSFIDSNSYNLVFVCAFKNTEEIDHLTRSLRKEFKEIIQEQEYLIIKEQILFNLFPDGLLEP